MHLLTAFELIPAGDSVIARREAWGSAHLIEIIKSSSGVAEMRNLITGEPEILPTASASADDWEVAY